MSAAMFSCTCPACLDRFPDTAITDTTWRQWQCPGCGSWNDHADVVIAAAIGADASGLSL